MNNDDLDTRCAKIFLRALEDELADPNSRFTTLIQPLLDAQPALSTPLELVEVVGALCERHPRLGEMLEAVMSARITDPQERKMLDIPPRGTIH